MIDINKISKTEIINSDKTKTTRKTNRVENKNRQKSYDFDPVNDLNVKLDKSGMYFCISINSNISKMLRNKIQNIRIIISYDYINKISPLYVKENIIDDFYFNVDDYYDLSKRNEIVKTGVLKYSSLINNSGTTLKYSSNRDALTKLVITKKSDLGGVFESTSGSINKYFDMIRQKDAKSLINITKSTVLMTHKINKKIDTNKKVYIKIIERSEAKSYNNTSTRRLINFSINDYNIDSFMNIQKNFENEYFETNNTLSSVGVINKLKTTHEISISNEAGENFKIYKKNSLKNKFKNVKNGRTSLSKNMTVSINSSTPSIYRVIDDKNKISDTFVGDVYDSFYNSKPEVSAFSLEGSIMLVVKNVPHDYLSRIVYRTEEMNKSTNKVIEVVDSSNFGDLDSKFQLIEDYNVGDNKSYKYQVKFICKESDTVITNESNLQKFIKTTGAYSLDSDIVTSENGTNITFTTTVPSADSKMLFDNIKESFPDISDEYTSNLVESYTNLSFVKLMAYEKNSGNISVIDIKGASDNKVEFNITGKFSETNEFVFFGEMFSNGLFSSLQLINSAARYEKGTNDHIPSAAVSKVILNTELENFVSKFTSYSSMNEGTLTYGKALSDLPGSVVESFKTGVIKVVEQDQKNSTNTSRLRIEKNISIVNRNVPYLEITIDNENVESILIATSSSTGINYRVEKGLIDDTDRKVTFFDYKAQYDFIDEIIDYFIIPVYNNYIVKSAIKVGTVVCSKDNFRSI